MEGLFTSGDGEEWVVRRELWRDRTNRCYLDGSVGTLRTLRESAAGHGASHGQPEEQRLLERRNERNAHRFGGRRAGDDARTVPIFMHHPAGSACERPHPVLPAHGRIEPRQASRDHHHRHLPEQLALVVEVVIQRGALHIELLGEATRRQRVEPDLVQELEGHFHDALGR